MPAIDPETLRPLGDNILVRRYRRPENYRGIILPEAFLDDATGSLWEVVGPMGPKAEPILGIRPSVDDLIKTPPMRGVHIGADKDGVEHFIIRATEVASVYRW